MKRTIFWTLLIELAGLGLTSNLGKPDGCGPWKIYHLSMIPIWAMTENLVLYPKNHLLDLTGLSSFSVLDIANFGVHLQYTNVYIHHFKTHPIFQTCFFFGWLFSWPSNILQLTNFKMGSSMGTGELGCSDPSKMVSDFSVCLGNHTHTHNLIYIYAYELQPKFMVMESSIRETRHFYFLEIELGIGKR